MDGSVCAVPGLRIRKLTSTFGAQIDGVDLRQPLSNETFTTIQAALVEHQVIFFRAQDLTEAQHRALADRFGLPGVYPPARLAGKTDDMSYIEDNAESPPKADDWHTDISWAAEPPKIAILNARIIPEHGGDTLWASLFAAYDGLSPTLQAICARLSVRHHPGADFLEKLKRSKQFGPDIAERLAAEFPPAVHPLVRTHPVSGRQALFVSGFMDQIVGMSRAESDLLLGYLKSRIEDPNLQVRWRWRPFDVAIWDEASTNHRALSDHYPQLRRVRRCTIEGERPFYRPVSPNET